jgi:formamidopyrimidine-DNA glycosylase
MPELPETETIARDLDGELGGRRIVDVVVERADVLREVDATAFEQRLREARIERCWRRAKMVVVDLDTGDRIVVQPRFTGALLIEQADGSGLPPEERRYSTLSLRLDDGRAVHYRDIRRLGTVALMTPARFEAYTRRLGDEPLDPEFTPERFSELVRDSRQVIKKLLMDQRALAGVGNIYANEALWRSGIDPSREARSLGWSEVVQLHAALTGVLAESIVARGTSFRDYRDAKGERGSFAEQLAAYGRAGLPCPRCGRRLVGTHAVDGRTTVFCAHCQR